MVLHACNKRSVLILVLTLISLALCSMIGPMICSQVCVPMLAPQLHYPHFGYTIVFLKVFGSHKDEDHDLKMAGNLGACGIGISMIVFLQKNSLPEDQSAFGYKNHFRHF